MSEQNLNQYDNGNGYNNGNRGNGQGGPNQGGSGQGGSGNPNPRKVNLLLLLIAALITLMVTSMFMRSMTADSQELSYSEFMQKVEEGKVKAVRYSSSRIDIEMVDENTSQRNPFWAAYGMGSRTTYYTALVSDDTLPERLREAGVEVWGYIPDNSGFIMEILLY